MAATPLFGSCMTFLAHTIKKIVSPVLVAPSALLLSYFVARSLFRFLPFLKQAFIYPTGLLVNSMGTPGEYSGGEWLYDHAHVRFVLGESCSGTTFFCLLLAFLVYHRVTGSLSSLALLLAFPVALLANAIRVSTSMLLYQVLDQLNLSQLQDTLHILTGVISFLGVLLTWHLILHRSHVDND